MFQARAPWNFDYRRVVLDEVALEGLDGIGIHGLWVRLQHRISMEVSKKLKSQAWSTLVKSRDSITFYELPEPAPNIKIFDRFSSVDEKGLLIEPTEYVDGPYVYSPIESELGSCRFYEERKEIAHEDISPLSYEEALERWGDRLVAVASLAERWHALAPDTPRCSCDSLRIAQYCMLELVGKSRTNGMMTAGITNLNKIVKDAKLLHYLKKDLQTMKLMETMVFLQRTNDRVFSACLLRLSRFTQPKIMNLPKSGILYALITHLQTMPDQTDNVVAARKALNINYRDMKKLVGRSDATQFLKVSHEPPPPSRIVKGKATKPLPTMLVRLDVRSEESASEEEGDEDLPSRYRVGAGLTRQAYERIVEAGGKGITLIELAQILNIDFYGSRLVLKALGAANKIRHIMEDKGRQRVRRYISIASLKKENSDFALEKEKLLRYIKDKKAYVAEKPSVAADITEYPVDPGWNAEYGIVEMRQFTEVPPQTSYSKLFQLNEKQPSLRLLVATNGIIELLQKLQVIHGIRELNILLNKHTGQDMMDSKTLKRILQKLIEDNLMRYYKINWPGRSTQHTFILCAPHITTRHPIIITHYREICLRSYRSAPAPKREPITEIPPEVMDIEYYHPKYMRARKLHEFLFEHVYVQQGEKYDGGLPLGFFNLVNIIPEMTVELMLGHLKVKNAVLVQLAANSSLTSLKIKNSTDEVCKTLLGAAAMVPILKKSIYTLAAFGLVQFCTDSCLQVDGATNSHKCIYFLNRNAKIVDTAGEWPDPNRERIEKRFHFEKLSDVSEFWSDLYLTSTLTAFKTKSTSERAVPPPVPLYDVEGASDRDNGDLAAGDGVGAGGLDSNYHLEYPNLWSAHYTKTARTPAGAKRKLLDLKNFPPRSRIPRKRPKLTRTETSKPSTKKVPKPPKAATVKSLPNKPGRTNVPHHQMSKPLKHRKRLMSLLNWSPLQDKIIIWTRVAKTFMNPTSIPGALQVANIVARECIARVSDPRSGAICHKRYLALRRDLSVQKTEARLVGELRRHPSVVEKYGGLLKKLRMKHLSPFSKFLQEAQLRMMELVWVISNLSISSTYDHSVPCIASDMADLHDRFTLKSNNPLKEKRFYNTFEDILFGSLRESVIQTMNSLVDGNGTMEQSMKIYNVFKDYPEIQLRLAIEDLRKVGVVAQRNKNLASNFIKVTSKEAVSYSSAFKLSAAYKRSWRSQYTSGFPDRIANALHSMTPSEDVESSSHTTCVLLESMAVGSVEIFISKKPTIKSLGLHGDPDIALTDADEKASVKIQRGKVGWKWKDKSFQRIKDLFDDIALNNEISLLCRKAFVLQPAQNDGAIEENIVAYLDNKGGIGATFQELSNACRMPTEILQDKLKQLESKKLIRKIGIKDNRIVLWKHLEPWTLTIDQDTVVPSPWISMGKTLIARSFLGWCGTVMQKVMDHPGCSIVKIAELCDLFISPRHIEEICTFLASLCCVEMKRIDYEEPGLFTDDDAEIHMDDCYEYIDPERILVFPLCDSLIRYALIKKKLSVYRD